MYIKIYYFYLANIITKYIIGYMFLIYLILNTYILFVSFISILTMFDISKNILDVFNNQCNYKKINELRNNNMRNRKNGIQLNNLFLYRFLYSKKDITKEHITSIINNKYNKQFTRQAYESKENNIPLQTYINLFNSLIKIFNNNYNQDNRKLIAIDGTYNNDIKQNEILNMGFYDITNDIPIDLESYGKENKNKEIKSSTDYIRKNLDVFKNNIIVCDRAYFSYEFLKFLVDNGIKFIIRVKGKAENFNPDKKLYNCTKNGDIIKQLRTSTRIIKYSNILHKTIYTDASKKGNKKNSVDIRNDCILVTTLDSNEYTDDKILELYKSRWDIEVFFKYIKYIFEFFKYIKYNYKYQHIPEKSSINFKKMYICELIITYLAKFIEKYYIKEHYKKEYPETKNNKKYKINKSNLVSGIFDTLLFDIFDNTLDNVRLAKFCKTYIHLIQNKTNRSFPRTSKTPFSKWYIKGYSDLTKFSKILNAITNNTVNTLNKNLKTIARSIISINGKKYG